MYKQSLFKMNSLINLWAICHSFWICNFINSLISWVCSFTEFYLSDTDNIAPFENTTPINLINLFCVLLFDLFIFINRIGVVFSNNKHPRDERINKVTYSWGVAECTWNLLGSWLMAVGIVCQYANFVCNMTVAKHIVRTAVTFCLCVCISQSNQSINQSINQSSHYVL